MKCSDTTGLSLHKFPEHLMRVDGDEEAAAAGQHLAFLIQDLGDINVLAALYFFLARLHAQWFVERDGLEVIDGHLAGNGDDVPQHVHLAHGFVEDGGDDAAVGVSGRAGVALAESEAADEAIALFVVGEAQAHAVGIVFAADETEILVRAQEAGAVARSGGFLGHPVILSRECRARS